MITKPRVTRVAPRVGVDIGGTFTDIVLALPDGSLRVSKVSSTPDDPGVAVVDGLAELLRVAGVAAGDVREIVHGTTVASNAVLQKTGPATGLITTRGFRDVLEIGRVRTPDLYDLTWVKPPPLVPRRHRREVDERIAADGSIVRPLDRDGVVAAAQHLVEARIRSIAICFINSYANPAHEREAERLVRDRFPDVDVTASYAVLPEIKEYERTSTTVANAYLLPVMRRYLDTLAASLKRLGIDAPLLVVASNGGVMGARQAAERPAFVVGSGPAAGVAGAARLGVAIDEPNLIVFDMGGTTAKAALVEHGRPALTTEYEFREGISTSSRFIKAGGVMLKVPAIDLAEVGTGAGSIAWIDDGGLLRVGPRSAGARPGPACYGIGGDTPTITDANVVLGYLNPEQLAGGRLKLRADLARDAITRHVARPLGLSVVEAAHGVRDVANASMARAIRAVTIERGRDPRDFTLVAFGGSGPVHACDVAAALEIRRVLVPVSPGVFTAVGMLASDVEHHFVRAAGGLLGDAGALERARERLAGLRREAVATLAAEGYDDARTRLEPQADLRYAGQASELIVPLPGGTLDAARLGALRDAFQTEYEATYGYASDEALELVNVRLVARGLSDRRLDFRAVGVADEPSTAARTRPVHFRRGAAPIETPVIGRADVGTTARPGPLVVESYDSTVVVPPEATIARDAFGNLVLVR
ncbi:MAG: hydantoinase/oxoprolinase family protein [Candidatus Rokubacteria bacterium]|nr:hydantoinase/oxoprolinase family protein [Candidatus Rokubacteria bacterium]